MTMELIEINWCSSSLDESRRVIRYLVDASLIAQAQIIPWIETHYLSDNKREIVQESKVVMKAALQNFNTIKDYIIQHSLEEIPEITYQTVTGGCPEFLSWLEGQLYLKFQNP